MLAFVTFVTIKFVTSLAKDMATSEISKTIVSGLLSGSKKVIIAGASLASSASKSGYDRLVNNSKMNPTDQDGATISHHEDGDLEDDQLVSETTSTKSATITTTTTTTQSSDQTSHDAKFMVTNRILSSVNSGFRILGQNIRETIGLTNIAVATSTRDDVNSTEYLITEWLETLFARFQMIILWHEPIISAYSICGLLSSYFLFTFFAPRLYAMILYGLFFYHGTRLWFRHIWPEIRLPPAEQALEAERMGLNGYTHLHPQILTSDELVKELGKWKRYCDHHVEKLILLRRDKPIIFCSLICSLLYVTAQIGETISGFNLIFFTIIIITIGPGIYIYIIPEFIRLKVQKFKYNFDISIEKMDELRNSTSSSSKTTHNKNDAELLLSMKTLTKNNNPLEVLSKYLKMEPVLGYLGMSSQPSQLDADEEINLIDDEHPGNDLMETGSEPAQSQLTRRHISRGSRSSSSSASIQEDENTRKLPTRLGRDQDDDQEVDGFVIL